MYRIILIGFALLLFACQQKERNQINENDDREMTSNPPTPPSNNEIEEVLPDLENKKPARSKPEKKKIEFSNSKETSEEEIKISDSKRKSVKKGKIVFDSTIYRLDTMQSGDIRDVEFRFWNEGQAPLTIKEVDVSCGCTTPTIPFLDILPGDTSKIQIQYNSVGKSGLQNPGIIVKSDGIPIYTKLQLVVFVAEEDKDIGTDTLSN